MKTLIDRQKEVSIDHHDDTPQLNDHQENISVSPRESKVTSEPILSADVKNVDKTVQMPECRLISEHSTIDNVESVDDETMDIIEFDVPDKILFLGKTTRFAFPSELCQMFYPLQVVSLTQGEVELDTNIILAPNVLAENQAGYWNLL